MATWTSTASLTCRDWPNGSSNYPTSFQYTGPFTRTGRPYAKVQFVSDIGGSSNLCNVATGAGCTVPPISAQFTRLVAQPAVHLTSRSHARMPLELRQ